MPAKTQMPVQLLAKKKVKKNKGENIFVTSWNPATLLIQLSNLTSEPWTAELRYKNLLFSKPQAQIFPKKAKVRARNLT